MHLPSGCSYVGILEVRLSYLNLKEQYTKGPVQEENSKGHLGSDAVKTLGQKMALIANKTKIRNFHRSWRLNSSTT